MKLQTLKSVILRKQKGAFSSIIWEHELPVKAALKATVTITKRTSGVVRCGVEYDNIGAVKEGRELGTLPSSNAGLTWGQWEQYPYFITHTNKEGQFNRYLRVALVNNTHFTTEYFINGRKANKNDCVALCIKSAFPTRETEPTVFSINVENILAIR